MRLQRTPDLRRPILPARTGNGTGRVVSHLGASLQGRIAEALMAKAGELLAQPPNIEKHDVLGAKA